MKNKQCIPKTKHIHKTIPSLLFTIALLLCTALIEPLTVHAGVVVEGNENVYEDEITYNAGGTSVYLGTYPKGCGYKGQGVLLYLLERNGGGPVSGTSPKAFPCSATMKTYELHAQDKYNRYPEVTTWESTYPYWAFRTTQNPVTANNGGFLTSSTRSFNTQDIKEWLKVPYGEGTQGIRMVQDIWGTKIAERFTKEEVILVAEPIVAIQFSQYRYAPLRYDPYTLNYLELLDNFKNIKGTIYNGNHQYTVGSTALEDFLDYAIPQLEQFKDLVESGDGTNYGPAINNAITGMLSTLRKNGFSEKGLKIYNPLLYHPEPIAGTPKYLSRYYDKVPSTIPIFKYTFYKNASGSTWYQKSANAASTINNPTVVCANANFTLWPVGRDVRIHHSTQSMETYAIGMLAMLAFTEDVGQTTCNERLIPTPHEAPDESDGVYTIIKSYRTRNTETNTLTDDGTYPFDNVTNTITIENEGLDEGCYQVIAWKTSTENITNLANFSVTWESSVPGIIGEQGDTITQVELPPSHKYLYVLLEKPENSDGLIPTNYTIPQSSITRHIYLSQPDRRLGMPKIEAHTFKWVFSEFTEGSCNHSYTCNSSSCSNKKYGTCNCNPCKSDCTTDHNGDAEGEGHRYTHTTACASNSWTCRGHTDHCTWGKWSDTTLKLRLNNANSNLYPDILATKSGWQTPSNLLSAGAWSSTFTKDSQTAFTVRSSNIDYSCIIHRGKDKLTLASWKNSATVNSLLSGVSSSGYSVANTNQGTRQTTDYLDIFAVKITNGSSDLTRSRVPSTKCSHHNDTTPCIKSVAGSFDDSNTSFNAQPTVTIKVYSGDASAASNNTDCTSTDIVTTSNSGSTIHSGRMVKSGSITFLPYIQMKFDTPTVSNQPVYVLGTFNRTLTLNSYAGVTWTKTSAPNITLSSLQWSTHAEANKNAEHKGKVLPGGATLTLSITKANRKEIQIVTYQPILKDAGANQVALTGGTSTLASEDDAKNNHMNFVINVVNNLEHLNIQQYWVDKDTAISPNTGIDVLGETKVGNGLTLPGGSSCSTEDKYYFSKDASSDGKNNSSTEGDLDVDIQSTVYNYYTFWVDPKGSIRIIENHPDYPQSNPYSGTEIARRKANTNTCEWVDSSLTPKAKAIDDKTKIVTKLVQGLEKGGGSDSTASTTQGDGRWYNESFDGVTYIEATTTILVGFSVPGERTTVLDPKLCPPNSGTSDLFTKFYTSQFKLQNNTNGNTDYVVAQFTDVSTSQTVDIKLDGMDKLFYSEKFYIPNVTTQDLH